MTKPNGVNRHQQIGNPHDWTEICFDQSVDVPQPDAFEFLRDVSSFLFDHCNVECALIADYEVGGLYVDLGENEGGSRLLLQWADRALEDQLVGCIVNWGANDEAMDESMYFRDTQECEVIVSQLRSGVAPSALQRFYTEDRLR